jgi:hypothetical protein
VAQVRALARLSWFFLTGTSAQLVAIGIVVYELLSDPDPDAKTELVRNSGHWERQFVAFFNLVFAFGGQFAFTGVCVCVCVWEGGGAAERACARARVNAGACARGCRARAPALRAPARPDAACCTRSAAAPHTSARPDVMCLPHTTELLTDMRTPSQFTRAISVCTVIMTTL